MESAAAAALRYTLAVCLLFTGTVSSDKRRNVLILLADDAGFELGAYGNKICQTPNIDALARRAVIFDNAFTSVSSCSPSRAALLTGAPSHEAGMYGLHHGVHHFSCFDRLANRSLPTLLRAHGLHTGIIGKKHVGPSSVFRFDFEQTEENNHIDQVGRNITLIKLLVRQFLADAASLDKPFFLYVGFHDPHRCGHLEPQWGPFCERWGTGQPGAGRIPDWTPWYYQWDEIQPPYHVPDTEPARRDLAAQYTTISRLDQGVGLVLAELAAAGHARDTLVVYTSDNGIPFPGGRTNLYEAGVRGPLLLAAPGAPPARRAELVSQLALAPTVLHWLGLPEPVVDDNLLQDGARARSLLPLLYEEPAAGAGAGAGAGEEPAVFLSQSLHEVTMYYPMRAVRTARYKLLHNLNYGMPFPIDQDLFVSPTFQDILNRTRNKQPLPWYTTLQRYYRRPEWQLFDVRADPAERRDLHGAPALAGVERALRARLRRWQRATSDPWLCAPHAVLEPAPAPAPGRQRCLSVSLDPAAHDPLDD